MTTVGLYQIYYKNNQLKGLDPDMIPYDNSALCRVFSELENEREYRVFKDNYEAKTHLDYDYTGFLSWKFLKKTNLSGEYFKNYIINDNLKRDVYFTSAGPTVTNVWKQGNNRHKGLIQITQPILNQLNYNINLRELWHDISKCSFCNYWVGNKSFWDKYMKFTVPIYNYLTSSENNMPEEHVKIYQSRADGGINSNYFSFIMERLFTTLLTVDDTITYKKIK